MHEYVNGPGSTRNPQQVWPLAASQFAVDISPSSTAHALHMRSAGGRKKSATAAVYLASGNAVVDEMCNSTARFTCTDYHSMCHLKHCGWSWSLFMILTNVTMEKLAQVFR